MKYKTPVAFEAALMHRLRAHHEQTGMPIDRLLKLIAFDRLMARFTASGLRYLTKGGFVLELRLDRARTTRDVDVSLYGDPTSLFDRVTEAAALDLADFFQFTLALPSRESLSVIAGAGVPYGGQRFKCTCLLGNKVFARFGLDVAIADPAAYEPELLAGLDWLAFAGIDPVWHPVLSREHHIAQKLHAYTLPREPERPNSRVKDLPDLILLARTGPIEMTAVRQAIDDTFTMRGSHPVVERLPPPPSTWAESYPPIADEIGLSQVTLADAHTAAARFIDPILGSRDEARWDPSSWSWAPRHAPAG